MVYGLWYWSLLCVSVSQLPILSSSPREHDAIAYHRIPSVRHLSWQPVQKQPSFPATSIEHNLFYFCRRHHAADVINDPEVLNQALSGS